MQPAPVARIRCGKPDGLPRLIRGKILAILWPSWGWRAWYPSPELRASPLFAFGIQLFSERHTRQIAALSRQWLARLAKHRFFERWELQGPTRAAVSSGERIGPCLGGGLTSGSCWPRWRTRCWRCYRSGEWFRRRLPGSRPAWLHTPRCLDLHRPSTACETDNLSWLQKAIDEPDQYVLYLRIDPSYKKLRFDPRYQQLLKRLKLDR